MRNQAEAIYAAERGLPHAPLTHVPSNVADGAGQPEPKGPWRRRPRVTLVEPPSARTVAGDRTEQRWKARSVPVMHHSLRPELEVPLRRL